MITALLHRARRSPSGDGAREATRPGGSACDRLVAVILVAACCLTAGCQRRGDAAAPGATAAGAAQPASAATAGATRCLAAGDGYLRARVQGALDLDVDWPNSGTHCAGESRPAPPGIRVSFERTPGSAPDLLFVFGVRDVRAGRPARGTPVNLTVIIQGSGRIYGTLGDSRCTIDELTQRPLPEPSTFRVEARGFCTGPARAVHGEDSVLVSTFEFAAPVHFDDSAATGEVTR